MVGREDNRFPIEITRVVDGDGFQAKVLDGSERTIDVRLYAIDAPESRQKYGREAANHLRQVVESGRFWLQAKGQDPNGRSVAIVYKDSFDISHTLNYLMVRAGWAYWYSQYEDGDNELELREAEATAYMEGKGVWQEPDLERPWAYKARILQERKIIERDEAIETAIRDTYREAAELGVTGWTDLHAAASKGFGPKLQELLSNGLNPNSRDSIGRTPLHVAISWEMVDLLLKKGADVNTEDVDGLTPLFYASWEGLEGVVEYLLKTEATVDASDGEGWTSLAVAVDKGFVKIVRELLSAGADPNLPGGPENWTPLHLAAKGQGVRPGAKEQNLYQASSKEGDIIEALIKAGADVNVVTSQGWTPLHIAAGYECVFAMRMLIRAGASTTARDRSGKTPEQLAAQVSGRSYHHDFAVWRGGYPSSNRAQGCGSLVLIFVLVMICGILAIVVS